MCPVMFTSLHNRWDYETVSGVSEYWQVYVVRTPSSQMTIHKLLRFSWASIKIAFNIVALCCCNIQETTCRADRQPQRREVHYRRVGQNWSKVPTGLSQTINTSMHGVPQILCSAGFSITNMIEPETCTTVNTHRCDSNHLTTLG